MIKASGPVLFVVLILHMVTYFPQPATPPPSQQSATRPTSQPTISKAPATKSVVYTNKEYGFRFSLPESWKGYSILTSEWTGEVYDEDGTRSPNDERGPELTIRHPLWNKANPREDIPLMIFTAAQWVLIERENLSVSAAPVGPEDIGRNAKYVFALPPRYLNDDATGSDEVLEIMKGQPLHAF
jgi:hypothetical protein